jgi:hypothetical protein
LPSVFCRVLGKGFAECPLKQKKTWKKFLLIGRGPHGIFRAKFVAGGIRTRDLSLAHYLL